MHLQSDGKSYYVEISHPGLNLYKMIRGKIPSEVEQKAQAQLAQWADTWQKKETQRLAQEARESKKERASRLTAKAQADVQDLKDILKHTLSIDDKLDWDLLMDRSEFSKPKPSIPRPPEPIPSAIPHPPMSSDPCFVSKTNVLDTLIRSRKQQKEDLGRQAYEQALESWKRTKAAIEQKDIEARRNYQQALGDWEKRKQAAEFQWQRERDVFLQARNLRNADVEKVRAAYLEKQPDAVKFYFETVLDRSTYPETLPKRVAKLDYQSEAKILIVEYNLPAPEEMPKVKEVKYVQSRDAIDEVILSDSVVNGLYDDVIYQITLRTIHEIFESDVATAVEMIVFNGWVHSIDKSNGQPINACILSLQTNREQFVAINLANVSPQACFKQLRGIGSSKLHGLAAVAPILQLDRNDKRFVAGRAVAERLDEGVNLAVMDWEDFEHLVRELFEHIFAQNGGEVKVTQASRDGGVDAVAFDPDPIRGGKIVIQAKRYTNTVGVSAVRDLYGTVMNEGATKGILVTTSNYGPDAYEFAKGKPLTLLSGGNLLSLLEKHGRKARIDLSEAKSAASSQNRA